ncbi:MAG TPA: two-component regulator propeller domain-containing protein [Methylomirabilota bacterium]|nr:two-component regulator propeller domain-containing protein [Methylomirabilota bacterium]
MSDLLHLVKAHFLAKRLLGLVTILFLSRAALLETVALSPRKALTQFIQDSWQDRDGLPQNSVEAILQTRDGYLWFGTQYGLARFDGVKFTSFDPRNVPAFEGGAYVRSLCESRDGSLWAGLDRGGVVRYRDGKFERFGPERGFTSSNARAIFEDRAGNVWVAAYAGVFRFHNGRFTLIPKVPTSNTYHIYEDPNGRLLCACDDGVYELANGALRKADLTGGTPMQWVRAIHTSPEGACWIGTIEGLFRFHNSKLEKFTEADGLPSSHIRQFLTDRDGSFWIATWGGLARHRDGRFEKLTTAEGLSDNFVYRLAEDMEGSLWIATRGGGVNRLMEGVVEPLSVSEGLSSNFAISLLEDDAGAVWIGTDSGGLNRWSQGAVETFTRAKGFPSDYGGALAQTPDGAIWIGTTFDILLRHTARETTVFRAQPGLPAADVHAALARRNGDLWLAAHGALSRYRDGRFERFSEKEGLRASSITCLHEDQQGRLWAAGDGLWREEGPRFHEVFDAGGERISDILALHSDAQGVIWVGSRGHGVTRLHNGVVQRYTSREGLFNDEIFAILEDDHENLWMSCSKGLFKVSKASFEKLDRGEAASLECRHYSTFDGMKSSQGERVGFPAGIRTRDGRLWFATIKGVAVVDPNQLRTNTVIPPVRIEEVHLDGESFEPSQANAFPPRAQQVRVDFTALSYRVPSRVRFRYRLVGLNEGWTESVGAMRTAQYLNLPAGEYRFEVTACNEDGLWNPKPATLGFSQAPHFYESKFFLGSVIALLGLAALTAHRLRLRRVRRQYDMVLAERQRIARELHDTLEQGLVGVSLQLDLAKATLSDGPEAARKWLDSASRMIQHSMDEAQRSVMDLRSPEREGLTLSEALQRLATELAPDGKPRISIHLDGDERKLSRDLENHIFRVAQEALTNALRHGKPSAICLTLAYTPSQLRLRVEDDGRGFPERKPSAAEGHYGLAGMQERAALMGARLLCSNLPAGGACVQLDVPLQAHRINPSKPLEQVSP